MIVEYNKKVELSKISDLYDVNTLAKDLGYSKEMIYYLRRKGELKSYEISSTRYVFKKEDVIEWLKEKGYATN